MVVFIHQHRLLEADDGLPGRNYLLGTSSSTSVKGQNRVGQTIFSASINPAILNSSLEYTFKINILSDAASGRLYLGWQTNWIVITDQDVKKGENIFTFTSKIPQGENFLMITADNSTANLTVIDPVLNEGTIAREWSPAPEDIQSEIQALKSKLGG